MSKIILASKSKARQGLLRQIGLKFKVAVSQAKESRMLIKSRPSDLVIENALRKAEAVAERFGSGVVIAADTIVLAGGRIIGKPKDRKAAARNLKLLSRRPHMVYTGLAVIDIGAGKRLTSYEKTKVYMSKLTSEQIRRYFRKASPMNKAGGFDIQGLGGVFIKRIEGCFYNVVGLPLAKLTGMLSEFGVNIFKP